MTTVGKVLVGLHLVLSFMFMAFAGAVYTAQNNWKTKSEANEAKFNAKDKDLANLRTEKENNETRMTGVINERDAEIVKLSGEKTALDNQVKTLTADNARLNNAVDNERSLAGLNQVEADERLREAALQREINKILYLTRNDLTAKLGETEDKRFGLELKLNELTEKHEKVLDDLRIIKMYLSSKNLPTDVRQMAALTVPPPDVDGFVVDYRKPAKGTQEFVEISLGFDEKLAKGHQLTVYNEKGYLGEIRLTEVYNDKAAGVVITKAKNAVIGKGDHVSTKFR